MLKYLKMLDAMSKRSCQEQCKVINVVKFVRKQIDENDYHIHRRTAKLASHLAVRLNCGVNY